MIKIVGFLFNCKIAIQKNPIIKLIKHTKYIKTGGCVPRTKFMKQDKKIKILRARENKIVMDNRLVQNISRRSYSLTLMEQKIIKYIISMIKPPENEEQEPQTIYNFSIQEFCKVCGIEASGNNYNVIKKSLEKIAMNSFWLDYGEGEILLQWIVAPDIQRSKGLIEIEISKKMIPFLFKLKEKFLNYELYQILALKSTYSIPLYDLLVSYLNLGKKEFDIEELKTIIDCPYSQYKDFRRYAIEPALNEINEFTNLQVEWEPIIKGRNVVKIKFKIKRKGEDEIYQSYINAIEKIDN